MYPAQFGASAGSDFVPVLPVLGFAVLVVYEPFVVSIFANLYLLSLVLRASVH